MKTLILLLVLALPVTAHAFDPWSRQDVALETTWMILHVLDWGQTLDLADQPDRYHELNPILGRNPSRSQVNLYMAASALLHVGVTHVLPAKCRPWFQYVSIGVSGMCVINNFSVGLSIRF